MRETTRRRFVTGASAAAAAGLSGCAGMLGSSDENTNANGSGETYDVGYGDYQTTVKASNFPDKLFVYAVQSGWSNWPAMMKAFEDEYGVPLNDDDRSSGEALKDLRAHAQNPTHSAYNGGYTYGILAMQDDLTQAYKPANWDTVPEKLKIDNGHMTATRRMTTAVTYRKDIYEELALQTPTAAVGLACALSINNARGGSMDDVQPVVDYYKNISEGGAEFTDN